MTDPAPIDPPAPTFGIDGKVAIVTGASSGIGARFAKVLAARGATVVAMARREERLTELAASTSGIVPFVGDVTSDDDLRQAVTVADDLGGVQIVVNNAGASDAPTFAEHQDPELFRSVVAVNLTACFVLSSVAAKSMIAAGRPGSIINIASIHGTAASAPNNQAAYVATKAGLIGLTKELAGQWARRHIRVNALSPGYFETELTAEMFTGEGADASQRFIQRGAYMRRAGIEGELDGALLLLASDAGSYLTGENINVDGGWLAH